MARNEDDCADAFGTCIPRRMLLARLNYSPTSQTQIFFLDSNMNGRVKSDGSSIGEDDDIATVEETFDEAETSSGLANTSPNSLRGSSPIIPAVVSSAALSNKDSSSTSSPTSAAVASVQAALAALQAGQMSLNQVCCITNDFIFLCQHLLNYTLFSYRQ